MSSAEEFLPILVIIMLVVFFAYFNRVTDKPPEAVEPKGEKTPADNLPIFIIPEHGAIMSQEQINFVFKTMRDSMSKSVHPRDWVFDMRNALNRTYNDFHWSVIWARGFASSFNAAVSLIFDAHNVVLNGVLKPPFRVCIAGKRKKGKKPMG